MIALIVSGGQTDPGQLSEQIQKLRTEKGLLIAADSGLEVLDQLIRQETQPELWTDISARRRWLLSDSFRKQTA